MYVIGILDHFHLLIDGGIPAWRVGGEEVESDAAPQPEETRAGTLENRTFVVDVRVIPMI